MRFGTMKRLEEMLEDAINDTFEERAYDESRLSRLEVKWKRFLSSSVGQKHRLQEEQRKIKMLISDISHQTKTPIANILLYSQLLQEKETDPELIPIVENIKEQSEKLDFLIRSLVKASRLESEVLILQPK
ncbi:MAG: sensor histidine kinase, partial [Lachnospiraceae bacterium]|nr:sensor histidine kinase [Lachnospiraceae bacterium]